MPLGHALSLGLPFRPSGAAFSPADLAPLVWLDSSDNSTITLNAGRVEIWDNKGTLGNTFAQAVAAERPVVDALPYGYMTQAIQFDGSNRSLAYSGPTTDANFLRGATDLEVWIINSPATAGGIPPGSQNPAGGTLFSSTNAAVQAGLLIQQNSTQYTFQLFNSAGGTYFNDGGPITNFMARTRYLLRHRFEGTVSPRVDHRELMGFPINNTSAVPVGSAAGGAGAMRVGRHGAAGPDYDGFLWQVIIFDRLLTTPQANALYTWCDQWLLRRSWSPLLLPDCRVWFDPTDNAVITFGAAPRIASVANKGTLGNAFSNAVAAEQPRQAGGPGVSNLPVEFYCAFDPAALTLQQLTYDGPATDLEFLLGNNGSWSLMGTTRESSAALVETIHWLGNTVLAAGGVRSFYDGTTNNNYNNDMLNDAGASIATADWIAGTGGGSIVAAHMRYTTGVDDFFTQPNSRAGTLDATVGAHGVVQGVVSLGCHTSLAANAFFGRMGHVVMCNDIPPSPLFEEWYEFHQLSLLTAGAL